MAIEPRPSFDSEPMQTIAAQRRVLGGALSRRADEVASIQEQLVGVAVESAVQRNGSAAAVRSFARWLATGSSDANVIGDLVRQGGTQLVRDVMSHRESTKLCLAWRDAIIGVLRDEAGSQAVSDAVLEDAVRAARASCDGFTVQLADSYDRERAGLQLQLIHHATHDSLTGLANRRLLFDRLAQWVGGEGDEPWLGVIFVDLDGFKAVNDVFGHAVGDGVLQAAAQRLECVRRDCDTMARFGGDEFVVLTSSTTRAHVKATAATVTQRIRSVLAEPFVIAAATISLSASVGLAIGSRPTDDPDELLRSADDAMYDEKRASRSASER